MHEPDTFDPYDLDREEFNSALCMVRYVQECSMPNMIARRDNLKREIYSANNKLEKLLYDNYQKFEDVTSVVVSMKTNFQSMEEEMDNLCEKINSIGKTSFDILENLRPAECKISKLLKYQNTMKKLVLLTDIVPTLKMLVDSGSYSKAAKHYLKAENVLNKYRHLPSLNGIVSDCEEIVVAIKSALRQKLNCEIYGNEELFDTLELLLALGDTPIFTLKLFLDSGGNCLTSLLNLMDETFARDLENKREERRANVVFNYIYSCCTFIDRLAMIIEVVKKIVISRNSPNDVNVSEFFHINMNKLSTELLNHMRTVFCEVDDDVLSQSLDKFVRHCHAFGILTTEINFYKEGMSTALEVCTSRCEYHLRKIKEEYNVQLVNLTKECSPRVYISTLLMLLREWIEQKLMSVLKSVTCYIRPEMRSCREAAFRKVFCKAIVREGIFVEFFRYIIERNRLLLSPEKIKVLNSVIYAAIAKLSSDLKTVISQIFSKVDDYLCSTTDHLSLTTVGDISREFQNAAQTFLKLYIQIRCQGMYQMLRTSMENKNWMQSKEPNRPRSVIKMILRDLVEAKTKLDKIFGVCENSVRKRASEHGRILFKTHSMEGSGQKFIQERLIMNKIFTETSDFSGKVESNTFSIMSCLLKSVLNSFVQFVRLKTFNNFSLQQIQVDVCYLQCHTIDLVVFDDIIQSQFDEIIFSAYNRTVEPCFLNNNILLIMCTEPPFLT